MDTPKTVNGLKIILGMGNTGHPSSPLTRFSDVQSTRSYLATFAARGYRHLDTSRNYPLGAPETSEPLMGETFPEVQVDGKKVEFIVDTKLRYDPPQAHTAEKVEESIRGSLEAMKIASIRAEFLHSIDETSDTRETCRAMDKAFKEGKIGLFGLSNASAIQIERFQVACEEEELGIRPNVLEEEYSALFRHVEDNGVMEKGREYGMSFHSYSPAGGGIFNPKSYRDRQGGRFDEKTAAGQFYRSKFYTDEVLQVVEKVRDACQEYGIDAHAMSLRWVVWHSSLSAKYGDGVIIGASTINQLNANLDAIESGPLPAGLVEAVEEAWRKVKAIAVSDDVFEIREKALGK